MQSRCRRAARNGKFWLTAKFVTLSILAAACGKDGTGATAACQSDQDCVTGSCVDGTCLASSVVPAGTDTVHATVAVDIPGGGTADVIFGGKKIGSGSAVEADLKVPRGSDRLLLARVPGNNAVWANLLSNSSGVVTATGTPGSMRVDARTTAASLVQMLPDLQPYCVAFVDRAILRAPTLPRGKIT